MDGALIANTTILGGSPSSLQAFDYALALARWQGARLNLLEVIEVPALPSVSRAPKVSGVLKETREALESDLKRVLASRGTSDVKTEIFMREGNVVQGILAQAKASRSDLVVIGRVRAAPDLPGRRCRSAERARPMARPDEPLRV